LEQLLIKNGFILVENIELQRYGIKNHLNWMLNIEQDILNEIDSLDSFEESYSRLLFSEGISDSLFVIAKISKVTDC